MKLQTRLLLSTLPIVFLAIGLTIGFSSIVTSREMENQVQANTQLVSKSYSTQLNQELILVQRITEDLASSVITSINIGTTLDDTRKRYPEFITIFYTDHSGKVRDMAPYNPQFLDQDFSANPDWQASRDSQKSLISQPGVYFGRPSVIVFSPALYGYIANASPLVDGMVCVVIPLDQLFASISKIVIGQTGRIAIIGKDGVFLEHPESAWVLQKHLTDLSAASNLAQVQTAMVSLSTGFATYNEQLERRFISFAPISQTGWSLGVMGNYGEFTKSILGTQIFSILIMLASLVVSSLLIFWAVHTVVIPIEQMTDAVQGVQRGEILVDFKPTSIKEVDILSVSLRSMVHSLLAHRQILEETVIERTRQLEETNDELQTINEELIASNSTLEATRDALWGEMELAHKLQTVLLPEQPVIKGYQIAAFMVTAAAVGGDYYDVIHVDGHDWFLIGDVSGHGVTSGLIMMMVQTAIHVALKHNPGMPPEKLLTLINHTIHGNIHKLGGQKYMTLTVFASHKDGRFSFSGAHLPLIYYRAASGNVEVAETPGVWIGLIQDIQGKNVDSEFTMAEDDVLLLYTDGITESRRKSGGRFTQDDLVESFRRVAQLKPAEICQNIHDEMSNLEFDDDVTIFVIKRVAD